MSRHQRYLENELAMIREEWAKGTRVKQIAFILGRDPVALTTKISEMGLPPRKPRKLVRWNHTN